MSKKTGFTLSGSKMLLIQFIITKTIKSLEHLSYERRQKELGLLSPGLGRREDGEEENHINVHQYLMAGCKKAGARLFPVVSSEKRQQAEIEIQETI